MWRHRKGNEIPAAILDVFDNLDYKTKDERKPVIIEKRKTENAGDEKNRKVDVIYPECHLKCTVGIRQTCNWLAQNN